MARVEEAPPEPVFPWWALLTAGLLAYGLVPVVMATQSSLDCGTSESGFKCHARYDSSSMYTPAVFLVLLGTALVAWGLYRLDRTRLGRTRLNP